MTYDCACYGSFEESDGVSAGVPFCAHEEAARDADRASAAERKAQALALIPPSPLRRKRASRG